MSDIEFLTDKEYLNRIKQNHYEKCLDIALDIRKFEIELYWKRSTYFWAFAVSILALMAFCFRNQNFLVETFYQVSLLLLNSLLIIINYVWYLSSKGSKYWQENWEQHVAVLENEITGPMYGSFHIVRKMSFPNSLLQGMPYSVSKLSMCLSIILIFSWLTLQIVIIIMTPLSLFWLLSLVLLFIICSFINVYGRFSHFDSVVKSKGDGAKFSFVVPNNKKYV